MENFPKDIREVAKREAGSIKSFSINLSIVIIDQPYHLAGNYFYLFTCPSGTYLDIKINETREQAISYVEQTGAKTPFDTLYITTPAGQTGTAVIIYATEAPELAEIIDNRAALSSDISDLIAELQGDTDEENWDTQKTIGVAASHVLASNTDRKACFVQAQKSNTGLIYIGFDNTVTATKWVVQLSAGMGWGVDDYRGDIYAIADAAGQLLGWGEW